MMIETRDDPCEGLQITRSRLIRAYVSFAALGVGVDCLINGVLKILWLIIYGPVYLGIAASIYNYLHVSRWRPFAWTMAVAFLSGAALGHLALTGRAQIRVYQMKLVSDAPITLQSPEFSDCLFVTSDRLRNALAQRASQENIPVAIQVIRNYGCIESFKVTSVAGVDVMSDPQAMWVWKPVAEFPARGAAHSGMKEENQRLPWCRIRWF
jgi:hypothetical protein